MDSVQRTLDTGDEIASVQIIRNSEQIFDERADDVSVQFIMRDHQLKHGEYWYYTRVVQRDGHMAWSSPVWVTVTK